MVTTPSTPGRKPAHPSGRTAPVEPASDAEIVRALVATLERDDTLATEAVQLIMDTVPGYDGVPAESLEASVRRNLDLSIRTILEGRAPDAERIGEAETLALERMTQGVSVGSVLAGFRLCMSVILRRLLELAPELGLPAARVLSVSTLLWSLGDAFSTRAVVVYQERGIAQAVADSARRARWIVDAVVTGLPRTELRRGAAAYGVPVDRPVRALRAARLTPDGDLAAEVHEWADRAGATALAAVHRDHAVGALIGDLADSPPPPGVTVALGPSVSLDDLPESFAVASRVLEAAHRVGFDGVVDLERLSWRMGVSASPETTDMLVRRYVLPVRAEGQFSDLILEAVRAYLANGLSIPRAAASVPVHVNTLRYRLKRFRELTGADLNAQETLIEVSWALVADRAAHDPASSRPPRS